jgi:hypothetical protein
LYPLCVSCAAYHRLSFAQEYLNASVDVVLLSNSHKKTSSQKSIPAKMFFYARYLGF